MSCGVGCRCGLDPALLWLWCRLVATASTRPLAWEPPHAMGAALEKAKRQKNIYIYPYQEFPLCLNGLSTQHSVSEDAGLIPGLTQWVKDLALL